MSGGADHLEETIVAPATAAGTAAVAIVRLSGPRAFSIARRMTGLCASEVPPRTLCRAVIRDARGADIDDGLAAFFPAPASYTGEDVVELHLHGSPCAVERAARAACEHGARPARPGEFTRRAFLSGKLDLTQAEAVADLIAARTAASAQAALRQLRGGLSARVGPLRERMVRLLAALEAAIDFSDEEDVEVVTHVQVQARVTEMASEIDRFAESYERGRRLRDGATVAIAGIPNVGKSRLLNRIVGEERAIVTEVPGTTRDYLSVDIDLAGIAVRFVDTAGLREPEGVVEREGVRRSRDVVAGADLTLFVLDGSRAAGEGDRRAYAGIADRPHLVVLNKTDLGRAEGGEAFRAGGFLEAFRVSAATGEGVEALLGAVSNAVLPAGSDILAEASLSRLRHLEAARRASGALRRAAEAARGRLPVELLAADVREAAQALAELTGGIAPEEVLDAIFDSFCIGK